MTRYLITGVTGQIGSYAAEQLIEAGHKVYGLVRGQKTPVVPEGVKVLRGDLLDAPSLRDAMVASDPEVIFNFGAATAIGQTWRQPELVTQVTGLGVLRLLAAVMNWNRDIRVVQASTADQFGNYKRSVGRGQTANEETPFAPRSPYGVAKQFAHDTCLYYREAYGLHVSTAIQFNCTSPRHGDEFVVRKVTKAAAAISLGLQDNLKLGDLTAVRDWSYAGDVAKAYPLIANQIQPNDFVLASGVGHSLQELVEKAFAAVDLNWKQHVIQDAALLRPVDVPVSIGDASKAWRLLGWKNPVKFGHLVRTMVHADREALLS